MRLTVFLAVVLGLACLPAERAAADPQAARIIAAFDDWAQTYKIENAGLAVMRNSTVIGSISVGNRKPQSVVPIASLSKAITGACVIKLVEAGRLKYSSKIGALLPGYFQRNRPADAQSKQITVKQLLTHTSGMPVDSISSRSPDFLALDFKKKNGEAVLAQALRYPLANKSFSLKNVNYVALGLVIEAVTGQAYEDHCRRSVLKPVGLDLKLDPNWKILWSAAGWKASVVEYARFLDHFRPESGLLKTGPAAWPRVKLDSDTSYGPGIYMLKRPQTFDIWHRGAWYWTQPGRMANYGAYYAVWKQNLRFVVTFTPQPLDFVEALVDLRHGLCRAAYTSSDPFCTASKLH